MKALELYPKCTSKAHFHYLNIGELPAAPGCYVLASYEEDILYIGKSKDIRRRIGEHLDDSSKTGMTPLGRASWVFYLRADAHNIDILERGWANEHELREGVLPVLNKIEPSA